MIKNKFLKSLISLVSGTLLSKVIAFSILPLITRMYTVDDFGQMSLTLSLMVTLAPILHFGYGFAIPLSKSENSRKVLYKLSLFVSLFSATFILLLFLALNHLSFNITGLNDLDVTLVVLGAFFLAFLEINTQSQIKSRKFKLVSINLVSRSVFSSMTKLILGWFSCANGLFIGVVTQDIPMSIYYFFKEKSVVLKPISKKRFKKVCFAYSVFPKFRLPSNLSLVLSSQAPLILCGIFYSVMEVGLLGVALNVVALPSSLMANSISQVFYGEILKIGPNNKEHIKKLLVKTNLWIVIISLPPVLILMFFSEEIFIFVFGNDWSVSGKFASILCVYVVFQVCAVVSIKTLHLFNEQKKLLNINIFRLVFGSSVFIIFGISDISIDIALAVYSFFMALSYSRTIAICWRKCNEVI
ncbi:lipopolysaccharide biosynthesis protein [Vibrio lentus]|uniref:lipopolysaccharide biosynthesis protein n=2 Tax=Bacteria TaxID=2 RepID=UPI000C852D82|nr:oligosaccharide flippase family protein [Vibrio lentus]PMI59213.1 hypothetical protein BCU41_22940 [Vibrio lentus]